MEEIYWITRLDAIENIFIWCLALGVVAIMVFTIVFVMNKAEFDSDGDDAAQQWMLFGKRHLTRWAIPLTIVGALGLTFVPNTKQAFLIYGVGGSIDYLKENPTVQKLPDKLIEALDGWVEELNPKDNYHEQIRRQN